MGDFGYFSLSRKTTIAKAQFGTSKPMKEKTYAASEDGRLLKRQDHKVLDSLNQGGRASPRMTQKKNQE
ncbi:MAG: hypothetical protein WC553_01435 [Patescibacteria group bacterium]